MLDLVDVSDIFFLFSVRCSGRGVRGARTGGSFFFCIGNPRRPGGGGGFQEGEGGRPRGREGVCGELGNFGGRGGLNIFFRGRNVHQVENFTSCDHLRQFVTDLLPSPFGFRRVYLLPKNLLSGRFRFAIAPTHHQSPETRKSQKTISKSEEYHFRPLTSELQTYPKSA